MYSEGEFRNVITKFDSTKGHQVHVYKHILDRIVSFDSDRELTRRIGKPIARALEKLFLKDATIIASGDLCQLLLKVRRTHRTGLCSIQSCFVLISIPHVEINVV
jgi:hypothetical protein